ncbi:MAG: GHKL domain-containing protein, partial [Verrucomicrobia bacterium]|nr:GHKL domain-containing protein [Verrucomicrobiota bacterium]
PPIIGDRIQLQQVILNLIVNAIEAMNSATESPRELLVSSEKVSAPEKSVLVSVADSGSGFNLNNLERLFDAFYTTKPNGLGMGLSISRSIVKAHRGRLWAMPNMPKGAIFQFTLPVAVSSER